VNVEESMNFILDSQARVEVRMDKLERQVNGTANLLRAVTWLTVQAASGGRRLS